MKHVFNSLFADPMACKCCRDKDEEESDIQELVVSFTGLEEKVLEQYTFAKV